MADSLRSIGAHEKSVFEVGSNSVIIFKNGVKVKEIKIDRSKMTQSRYEYSNKSNTSYYGDRNLCHNDRFLGESAYEDYVEGRKNKNNKQIELPWTSAKVKDARRKVITASLEGGKNPFVRYFDSYSEPFRIQAEICDQYNSKVIRKAVYNKSRYWMGGGLMHGVYLLNGIGMVPNRLTMDSSILKPYFFVEGILLDGVTSYNKVMAMHTKFIDAITYDVTTICEEEQKFSKSVVRHSRYPVASLTGNIGEQDCFACMKSEEDDHFYDGSYRPLFSDKEYSFINGDLSDIKVFKEGFRMATHDSGDADLSTIYFKTCREDPSRDDHFNIGMKLIYMGGFDNPFSPFQGMMFGYTELTDEKDVQLFWIHYMRDFRNDIKVACNLCPCRMSSALSICVVCKECEKESKKIASEVSYEVFK
jgi:hypothetical protein